MDPNVFIFHLRKEQLRNAARVAHGFSHATEVCSGCPRIEQCRDWAKAKGPDGESEIERTVLYATAAVYGGILYASHSIMSAHNIRQWCFSLGVRYEVVNTSIRKK